jgi:DNA processing protein
MNSDVLCDVIGRKVDISSELSGIRESAEFVKEMRFIATEGIKAVSLLDDNYPELLKNIYDPPPVLFVKGNLEDLNRDSIAVVGSRRCSFYGINMSEQISYSLAGKNFAVVSGMARGIDTAAHRGALRAGGGTIAVMGSGFSRIYPPEAVPLYGDISKKGAVITEYTSEVEPLRRNFPRRNRIISGLCHGVVVVEAGHKSGAMITANLALDQGREVFAFPGRADTVYSKGTNFLIQNGAKLIMTIDDILEELGPVRPVKTKNRTKDMKNSFDTEHENRIFHILSAERNCLHIDDIYEKSDMEYARLSEILLKMECSGVVKSIPGKKFILKNN